MSRPGPNGAILASLALLFSSLAAQAQSAAVHGRVVDFQTGEPIAKAAVSVAGQPKTVATTNADGRFTLDGLPAGPIELRVTTVGYGLLKKHVDLAAGATVDLDLRLGQDALRDTQEITVTTGPFDAVVPDAISQYSLENKEMQDLSSVLANDPFRAVDNLPGVAANQDFYASFAVRGAGPEHVGVYIDGVLVDHPTYSLEDAGALGSFSAVNGEVVRSISLLSGGFPANYGDRTGAILDVATRDGARDRIVTRFLADVLGAVLTSEGPIGRRKNASWLVSGRQSYLAYMLQRLGVASTISLNYSDLAGGLSFEPTPHHRLRFTSTYGFTSISRSPVNIGSQEASYFTNGAAQHGMNTLHWDWIVSPHTLAQARAYWTRDHEHDTNPAGALDLDTTSDVYGIREDVTRQFAGWNKLEAGFESRSPNQQRLSFTQWNYPAKVVTTALRPLDNYAKSDWQPGGYVTDAATLLHSRLTLATGGRWERGGPIDQDVWLPHASAIFRATPSTAVTAAYGQYAQIPSLMQVYGAFGNPNLRAERATHETFAIDQFLNEKIRLHLELYNRQEHEDIYSAQTEFRLLSTGVVGFPVIGPTLGNNLDGYARGFEISLQRRSANRLSGWVSYAFSHTRYWQPGPTLAFDGDYDQRHTVSAYAAYRLTRTLDLSASTRYGSGLPVPGYFASSTLKVPGDPNSTTGVIYLLSQYRNALREDDYQKTDIRINKALTLKRFNLTIHGEIENLTAHDNYSYYQFVYPPNVATARSAQATRQTTLPFLPAAGFTFEF